MFLRTKKAQNIKKRISKFDFQMTSRLIRRKPSSKCKGKPQTRRDDGQFVPRTEDCVRVGKESHDSGKKAAR